MTNGISIIFVSSSEAFDVAKIMNVIMVTKQNKIDNHFGNIFVWKKPIAHTETPNIEDE